MSETKAFQIPYTIGYNFDYNYINEITGIDKFNQIKSVYGRMKTDWIYYNKNSSNISFKQLKKHVENCRKNNIEFNYLFDSPCTGNKEFYAKHNYKLMKFLNKLSEIGINRITISSPYFCELIKRNFPNFYITLSEQAYAYSMQLIKYWEEKGVSEIVISLDITRNFFILEQILNYTKKTGTCITIIANSLCLYNCPNKTYHNTSLAHAKQKNHKSENFFLDYSKLYCTYEKIKNPLKYLSSNWIRPEDIKLYEKLCRKTGNYNVTMKLLKNSNQTDSLITVIKAYLINSFDGNLLSLLSQSGYENNNKKMKIFKKFKEFFLLNNVNKKKYYNFYKTMPKITIENKKLDGFMNNITAKNDCYLKTCSSCLKSQDSNTDNCLYCHNWAKKTINYDKIKRSEWLKNAESLLESFNKSNIYK